MSSVLRKVAEEQLRRYGIEKRVSKTMMKKCCSETAGASSQGGALRLRNPLSTVMLQERLDSTSRTAMGKERRCATRCFVVQRLRETTPHHDWPNMACRSLLPREEDARGAAPRQCHVEFRKNQSTEQLDQAHRPAHEG